MSETRPTPRCLFGNFVNELMVQVPDERHARALVAVSPRKIWLARPGDLLVLPASAPTAFWHYAHDLLGLAPGSVEVLTADSATRLIPLADRLEELGLVDRLASLLTERPGIQGVPFALDRPTLRLFDRLALPVEGYGPVPDTAVEAAYRINTKSGFRELAAELGLPIAPGRFCPDPATLRSEVGRLVAAGKGAVVKLDRSSNGFGLLFVRPEEDPAGLDRILTDHLRSLASQPPGWVVEELMPVEQVLTVEMWSAESGPKVEHSGQMLTPNGSFSGQLTPPREWPEQLDELSTHGLVWGDWLHRAGYRGPFDLDAITAEGRLYVTESNVRRTGTTYLEHLLRRLVPADRDPVWLADSRVGGNPLDFGSAVAALNSAGIGFRAGTGTGVVLTADTRAFDRKWRFLIIGHDHDQVSRLEKELGDVLELA